VVVGVMVFLDEMNEREKRRIKLKEGSLIVLESNLTD
jgi:hypothetical protein